MTTRRYAVGVEYDGHGFVGWQVQKDGRSVQSSLEAALSRVADHHVPVVGAGRTDSGVHATCQVAHFDTTAVRREREWILGANTHLPMEAAVRWLREVPVDFHARYSAEARSYTYVILNRRYRSPLARHRAAWIHRPLDHEAMADAAQALVGEHDFTSFRAAGCQSRTPVRRLHEVAVTRDEDVVRIDVTGNAFLHHMVRNIAGSLMRVGKGEETTSWVGELLAARDRTLAGMTAPPEGLYLTRVHYAQELGLPEPEAIRLVL